MSGAVVSSPCIYNYSHTLPVFDAEGLRRGSCHVSGLLLPSN